MLANVLQKADSHILERRLVEKREQGEGMPFIRCTRSSIYSHGVVIVVCVEELGFVAASDMTMTDWVSFKLHRCKYALPHYCKVQSGPTTS